MTCVFVYHHAIESGHPNTARLAMLSVIFSSHNGARTLPQTLASFQEVRHPSSGVEFIGIDNASSDYTQLILESYRSTIPLHILNEPRPGKSLAINLGLKSAQGDLIVFTDDDVIADPDLLLAYERAASKYPDISIFAGQVRHYWEKTPPKWLEYLAQEGRSYGGTHINLSDGPVSLYHVKGANFMVRRSVISQIQFSEDPGITFTGQGSSQGGEDTLFVRRALEKGHKLYHVKGARVEHIVRKEQIGVLPVFQRYVRIGRASVLQNPIRNTYPGPKIFGYPRYLYQTMPRDFADIAWKWVTGRSCEGANDMVNLAMKCGQHIEKKRQNTPLKRY